MKFASCYLLILEEISDNICIVLNDYNYISVRRIFRNSKARFVDITVMLITIKHFIYYTTKFVVLFISILHKQEMIEGIGSC